MGTRHNITIRKNGKVMLSQYGQWDGYPDGQGLDLLKFLRNKVKVQELKNAVSKLRFLDKEGKDKKFSEDYDKNAPEWSNDEDKRTEEQRAWFRTFITRDLGAKILQNIINSDLDEILVIENEDKGWCEGFFNIDLDKMVYDLEYHGYKETFDINNLPEEEEFIQMFREWDEE